MKNLLPILLFVLVVGGVIYFVTKDSSSSPSSGQSASNANGAASEGGASGDGASQNSGDMFSNEDGETGEDEQEEMIRPAAEVYKSADEALEAAKKGAVDYDDVVLEQFTLPGDDCTWCSEFYSSIRNLMADTSVTDDQRSFYAELLAISGRTDNIGSLINGARGAGKPEEANAYLEAIELTVGNDEVVKFLGSQLDGSTEPVKESLIAAITNQGTRSAAEILIKETEKSSDPDGFYNKGIGLGEFIPEPESYPLLQEVMKKRDPKIAPLAAKSLLNSGIDGLRMVFDELSSSKDPASDQLLIKGAIDHVSYDEEVEEYLKQMAEKGNQTQKDFASSILKDFQQAAEEIGAEGEDEELQVQ